MPEVPATLKQQLADYFEAQVNGTHKLANNATDKNSHSPLLEPATKSTAPAQGNEGRYHTTVGMSSVTGLRPGVDPVSALTHVVRSEF